MLHARVLLFLKTSAFMCLLVKFLYFDLPQSMFKFINAKITPKKRERSESRFTLYVMCVVFLMKIGPF